MDGLLGWCPGVQYDALMELDAKAVQWIEALQKTGIEKVGG